MTDRCCHKCDECTILDECYNLRYTVETLDQKMYRISSDAGTVYNKLMQIRDRLTTDLDDLAKSMSKLV